MLKNHFCYTPCYSKKGFTFTFRINEIETIRKCQTQQNTSLSLEV